VSRAFTGPDGRAHVERTLLTQDDILAEVSTIVAARGGSGVGGSAPDRMLPNVDAWPGGLDQGLLRPAEIVAFTPSVPDTLILNQVP
jgi:hypothetical protein